MAKPSDPRLLCRNGHPVDRIKKLKAWQGYLHGKECSICMSGLDREQERWTCSGRCTWNVCRKCYDVHWSRVIQKASRTEDDRLRAMLLDAVPEARRKYNDFLAAEQGRKAQLTPSSEWRVPMSPRSAQGSELPAASMGPGSPISKQALQEWLQLRDERVQVPLWLAAGAAATGLAFWAASVLLRSEDLAFPHPFLLVGFSQLGTLLLCRLVVYFLGAPPEPPMPPAPPGPPGAPSPAAQAREAEWKAAGILGLMYGVDCCIGASLLYHLSLVSRDAAYVLTPAAMLGAGILAGTDQPETRCVQSVVGITLGGLLMSLGGFVDWDILKLMLLALLADVVKMFRWVFTRNVLPEQSGASLLIFAARMTTTTAAAGFELAFMTDFDCYIGLFGLPKPGEVAALVLATTVGVAVKLVSELHLAQLTSVTVLGFFTPLLNVGLTVLAVVCGGERASLWSCLGASLCVGGMGYYAYLRQREQEADLTVTVEPPMPSTTSAGYVRLPAEGLAGPQQHLRPLPPPAAGYSPHVGWQSPSVASRHSAPGRSAPGPSPAGRSSVPGPSPRPSPPATHRAMPVPPSGVRSAPGWLRGPA